MGWTLAVPTSRSLMQGLLDGKVTEKELSARAKEEKSYEALYLLATIVLPGVRKQGIASTLRQSQLSYFQEKYGITDFYACIFSQEGGYLVDKVEKDLGIEIKRLYDLPDPHMDSAEI